MKKLKEYYIQKKNEFVADEKKWQYYKNAAVFAILGLTSLLMSVVNFFTHEGILIWVTLGFAAACVVDFLLLRKRGTAGMVAVILFSAEIIAIFVFFIISGIPDGFSVLWTSMLPCFGLLMFGTKNGSVISLTMFAVLVFFFWTPPGQSLLQYDYGATFELRFPFLYLAFFAVAVLLEKIRNTIDSALKESREKYEFLCYHDALTGQYNRFWFQSVASDPARYRIKPAAVAILDIDNFKFVNDSFGHPSGDLVIQDLGQATLETLQGSGDLCRWGGDEFLILFHTDIDAEMVCRRIVDAVRAREFCFGDEHFAATLSVGLAVAPNGGTDNINALIHQADINLYQAKSKGKNCTVCSVPEAQDS